MTGQGRRMDHDGALFELLRAGDHGQGRFVASVHARGPWDPGSCHGGPVAALLTRAAERCQPGDTDWHLARITVELTRPVPVGQALDLTTEVERPGRKVSTVAALIAVDGVEVARARALRIRSTDLPIPATGTDHHAGMPRSPEESTIEPFPMLGDEHSFGSSGCELRFAAGSWTEPGPVAVWIRLRRPLLEGEEPTGAQRAVAAADFGNGVSSVLAWDQYLFINPDLTVHLVRPPAHEWIGLAASTALSHDGTGLAESALYDGTAMVGRSVQSLFVDRRA